MSLTRGLLVLVVLTCTARISSAQPSDMLARSASAVVRVISSDCVGDDRTRSGSGFVWRSQGRVVTALHVVAGCSHVKVGFQGASEADARVERVFGKADLVLLTVASAPVTAILESTVDIPGTNETVYAYGFPLGIATRVDTALRVVDANRDFYRLSQTLDQGAQEELRRLGSPSLDIEVLRTDGNLVPGHSGAAILDGNGRVVAVGSGGLQRGTVGIGWSIRARYLDDLLKSSETLKTYTAADRIGTRFAVLSSGEKATARCGDLDLTRTRTMRYADLAAQTDDPLGLTQLLSTVGRSAESIAGLKFDIWVERKTGGAIALLADAPLRQGSSLCTVDVEPGAVQVIIGGTSHLPALQDARWSTLVQAASSQFEQSWSTDIAQYSMLDPRWSYNSVRAMNAGIVNRKTFVGRVPGMEPHAAFETLAARREAFFGIVAITRKYGPAPPLAESTYQRWYGSAIGVHLSTFPP